MRLADDLAADVAGDLRVPGAAVRSAPLALWVTLNSPIVVSGVFARWAAMPSSISQYGTKP